MANGAYEGHMANRKVRASFLLLEQTKKKTIRWKKEKRKERRKRKEMRKRKERRKKENEERKENEENKRDEGNSFVEEKGGKKGKGLRFPVFRQSEVVSPRIKVGLLDESYEYVPKTKEVGFSPTLVPLNIRAVNGCVVQPQP